MMKTSLFAIVLLPVLLAFEISSVAASRLKVMSFNMKFDEHTERAEWKARKSAITKVLLSQTPDLVGTQELLYAQLLEVALACPEYGWIGNGRNGGRDGEFSAIFYRKARLQLLAQGQYWLSDTPEVPGSITWDTRFPRIVTWGRFLDLESGKEIYHWNTHLDNRSASAREKGAELLLRLMRDESHSLPLVLTGDFNTDPASLVHSILTGGSQSGPVLVDSVTEARHDSDQIATYHFGILVSSQDPKWRIDWILGSRDLLPREYQVITSRDNGVHPSDHYPVLAIFEY